MKKINWKEVWEETKQRGNPSGLEKWILYVGIFWLVFTYVRWWLES